MPLFAASSIAIALPDDAGGFSRNRFGSSKVRAQCQKAADCEQYSHGMYKQLWERCRHPCITCREPRRSAAKTMSRRHNFQFCSRKRF